jgi:hypothetical protein
MISLPRRVIDAPPRAQVYPQFQNAVAYGRNISHQAPFQPLDPRQHHAADHLVLETVDPGREPRKRSDREHDSIVIDRLHVGNHGLGNPGTGHLVSEAMW